MDIELDFYAQDRAHGQHNLTRKTFERTFHTKSLASRAACASTTFVVETGNCWCCSAAFLRTGGAPWIHPLESVAWAPPHTRAGGHKATARDRDAR